MNHWRKDPKSPAKNLGLFSTDPKIRAKGREFGKENDSAMANRSLRACGNFGDVPSSYGSQNYVLKLSESCISDSTRFRSKNNTTVSISDTNSSSDNSPRFKAGKKLLAKRNPRPPGDVIVIESSSDSEEEVLGKKQSRGVISLDSDDDSILNMLKIDSYKPKKVDKAEEAFDQLKKSSELSFNSGRSSKRAERGKHGSRSSSSGSSSTNFGSGRLRGRIMAGKQIISESSSNDENNAGVLNSSRRSKSRTESRHLGNSKPYDSVKLTKKDAVRIFEGTKPGGNPHWTPKFGPETYADSFSSSSQGVCGKEGGGKIIGETPSDAELDSSSEEAEIISNSSQDYKPRKTHVSRFINTPSEEQNYYSSLSDRKKTDISHWLMNNTPGSSSSSSIISESNRNSSFGNSSLERFELKHETPNNRGKISKPGTPKVQTAIDRFIYKGKTSVVKTPLQEKGKPTPQDDGNKRVLPVVKDMQNLQIQDCADILDKLYGDVWRNKAEAVLTPRTEPRPRTKQTVNRGRSKTDKKPTAKSGKENFLPSSNSDDNDEFENFAKEIRPNFNSTKKKPPGDSFIDDKSPSENSSESFYHTALTNPRESKDHRVARPLPVSAATKRVVEICDSDSDNDYDNYGQILDEDVNRKRLSFSDDESNSSTSEFDPGEVVPPKPKAKKAPVKTSRQKLKAADRSQAPSKLGVGDQKTRSFLASLSNTVPIQNCHPQARVYRDNYKNKKEELCKYLFQLYNKQIFDGKLPNEMPIEWNVRMRGTAGFCYNRKSVKALGGIVRSSRIVLATKILDTPDRLRDTLIHEMCHAAAWLINNVSDGHGPFWKGWASKAIKAFPELPPIKRCHDYKIKTKFTYRCTKCGYSIGRHSKSLNVESKRCGHCYGKFELLINRTTRSGTAQVATPVQARTPSGFALYVKENYHTVKQNRRSIKHAEVMKILGQQFSAIKIGKKPGIDDART